VYSIKGKVFDIFFLAVSICQLHCKPKKKYYSVMMKDAVTDGTPCILGQRDMCIAGRCRVSQGSDTEYRIIQFLIKKIGCDWKIDSSAVEDQCGVCHGDGSTCKTVSQNFITKSGRGG
jgi:hypothetical protein